MCKPSRTIIIQDDEKWTKSWMNTVKPGYKDLGYKDNLTDKDTILGPE